MATPPPAKKIKIDDGFKSARTANTPAEDLVLRVGSDKSTGVVELRVHRLLLELASPTFAALFGQHFAEASIRQSESPVLHLTDDDPVAFTDLHKILYHHPFHDAEFVLSNLMNLAILTDKYSCTHLIQRMVQIHLGPLFMSGVTEKPRLCDLPREPFEIHGVNPMDIMCISNIVKDSRLFWRSSREVIAYHDVEWLQENTRQEVVELLPTNIFESLKSVQSREIEELETIKRRPTAELFTRFAAAKEQLCTSATQMIGVYELSLWEMERVVEETPIPGKMWIWYSTLAKFFKTGAVKHSCGRKCVCRVELLDVSLQRLLQEHKAKCKGLCLDCENRPDAGDCTHDFAK